MKSKKHTKNRNKILFYLSGTSIILFTTGVILAIDGMLGNIVWDFPLDFYFWLSIPLLVSSFFLAETTFYLENKMETKQKHE